MKKVLINLIVIIFVFAPNVIAENKYYNEGINYFKSKNYQKAKFKFEQDIVRNPKNEDSYLYLSKIFKEQKKIKLEEENLQTVILLNPKNEEAIYSLALLNIDKSNFSETKKLLETFKKICKTICSKKEEIKNKLNNSLKK